MSAFRVVATDSTSGATQAEASGQLVAADHRLERTATNTTNMYSAELAADGPAATLVGQVKAILRTDSETPHSSGGGGSQVRYMFVDQNTSGAPTDATTAAGKPSSLFSIDESTGAISTRTAHIHPTAIERDIGILLLVQAVYSPNSSSTASSSNELRKFKLAFSNLVVQHKFVHSDNF